MSTYFIKSFYGGISDSSKRGIEGSYQDGKGIDIRSDIDSITSLRKLKKDSASSVTGFVKWMVEYLTDLWMYDDAGKIYKRTSGGTYTNPKTAATSTGQGMAIFNTLNADALWYANSSTIGRGTNLVSSPSFTDVYLEVARQDVDQTQNNGVANTYTTPTSISEAATARASFTPTKHSIASFGVYVTAKGTGNWTVTLHDSNNVSLGTSTITNGTLVNGALNRFILSSQSVNLIPGVEYHIHVTSTVADGTVGTSVASDLTTAYFETYIRILEADSDFHPMKEISNLLLIGNGNYVATLDDSEIYNSERLQFPRGEKVRCIERIGSYAAIATWQGASLGDYGTSRLYLWDTVSPTINDFVEIDGQINAIKNSGDNHLYILHGTQGHLSVYTGAVTPVKTLKDVGQNSTVEFYPDAMAIWEKILHFGISGGTSTTVDKSVYTYGRKDKEQPMTLTKDYTISTGNSGSTVLIGSIIGISATRFFLSWKDSTTGSAVYGIDIIDTATTQTQSYVITRRFDANAPYLEKKSTTLSINYTPLAIGQSIQVQYRLNTKGDYLDLFTASYTEDGESVYRSHPFQYRWLELELKITLFGDSTPPVLYSVAVEFEIAPKFQMSNVK